jgi:hypothetical protein
LLASSAKICDLKLQIFALLLTILNVLAVFSSLIYLAEPDLSSEAYLRHRAQTLEREVGLPPALDDASSP